MADEQAGKRMNFQVWWLSSLLTWGWKTQQTQQTQQTWSTMQTGAVQQQKTTPFLPWISDNAELQAKNKVSTNNGFIQWIQSWNIKTNIQLPWITTKPVEENTATLSPTTDKQKRQSYIYASNNNINTKSTAEQIEEERTSTWKVLWQIDNVWKTYVKAPINNYKKRWFRAIWDSWLTQNFIKKTLEKDWINLSDNTMESIDNIWQHIVQAYTDKINEDFRKLEEKNLDPKIKEKYDNSTIADLIWQGDFAGAFYKMNKWTAENWQMIPEIWLMFVSWPAWLAVMGADVYVQENQWTFEDMINNGATYEEARNWAIVVWIVNAGIELLSERLLWWAKWAGATAFRRLFLKEVQHEVVKTATKKWMAEIFSNWIKEIIKWSLVEWFEEVLQQIVWNAMVRTVNPDRELTEWSYEAFEWGFFNLFNPIWWWVNMVNEYQSNKQITKNADIEALKYVAEWEQRKAQRIQAKERLKARFMQNEMNPTMDNGYTPSKEQAEQRAKEKEENEQYEQELREEQNRENSKYQTQEWNNSWLSNSNNYDTNTNVGSNGEVNSPVTDSTFFNTDENWDYINYNGRKIYAGSKAWTKDQFTQLSDNTPYNPEYEEYFRNFQRLVEKLSDPKVSKRDTEIIWHTIKWKEVKMSKQALRHIFESHWKFNINTILEAINNPSWQKRETETTWNNKNKRPYMVLNLVDPSKKVIVAIKANNWATNTEDADFYYVVSSRESNAPTTPSEDVKFQLKYEDKDYTPWVANKNEKDISWKEWLNLRNKLNKETVKQLAEKYWIKVEVIEWMIEILEKGIKKWYAYGKYVDDLLTLSEQIKESTAPHELLHAIFDMIDPETKTYLISQVMQSEWWTAEQSEEWLADSFSNFFRTGKIEWAPKSTRWKIKMFFKRVRSFVNWMNKWRNELEEIFTDIIDAKGIEDLQSRINQNEKIIKAKEKMKKRFMEYEKNAEKIKSEKKNDEKYQTVYHGSPYEFEKFDSTNMWKWEWAQAHWWGHYVAVDEKTWRHYAELNSRMWYAQYKWETLNDLYRSVNLRSPEWEEKSLAVDILTAHKDYNLSIPEAIKKSKEYYENEIKKYEDFLKDEWLAEMHKTYRSLIEKYKKKIDIINNMKESDFTWTNRNLYGVEIPDPAKANTPTWKNYLEEDWKIIKSQMDKIYDEVVKEYEKKKQWKAKRVQNLQDGRLKTFRNLIDQAPWMLSDWKWLYSTLSNVLWWQEQASKFLESLWYDGIHYFWGRDWEAYVIFNDNALEITNHEKYQKAWDINSEKFKKRFGDSKVVDKNWKPMVVYHGTPYWWFTVFDKVNRWSIWDTWYFWDGFYFTNDKKLAKDYSDEAFIDPEERTKEAWQYGNVEIKEVYLKIENPYKINEKDVDYEMWSLEKLLWTKNPSESTKKLKSLWYDGIIYTFNSWTKEYTVFDPNQIKSATDNIWTYDINNPDIRYQRVYHWSPNAFDKFDSTHMWEWEGNQAHGRWHYVAVDPKTARTYAQEKFYKNEIEVKWRTMSRVDEVRDIPYALRSLYRDLFNTFAMWYYDVEEEAQNVIDRAKKEYEQTVEYYEKQIRENVKPPVEWVDMEALQADRKKYLAEFKEALEFIEELTPEDVQVREINDRRNFYEVEIPDPVKADTPTWSNYLEEKKNFWQRALKKFKEYLSKYNLPYTNKWLNEWHIHNWEDLYSALSEDFRSDAWASKFLEKMWYDGIHYDWQKDGECYVIFNDDDLEIKNHEKYQKAEYEYDENGNPKRLKFEEDNNEFDPSIFDWSREDQIESDKESEKNNAFYNAWIRYNNQNYKDDQLTFDEFIQWISKRAEKEQEIYDEKMKSLADSQNDPKLLELQLKAVKLMEKEQRVGKNPNGKNVSKEVRERQQKEVETERENLAKEIFDYMYPWLKFEDQTYDDQKTARDKEAEREMMGRQEIEEKLKLYKKDKNGNREAKDIKIDNPDIKLDKILSSWKFDEIFEPLDRVIEWKTPQGQKGRIDNQKDPKKYKSVMEKINSWKSKTKVTLKDVTQEARALEKYKAEQEAEKERKKKERQEAFAKKKQEEYKKNVRLKAFQKLVDMQRFEKYTFLTEDEIKKRRWFSDEEWKKITEQQDINFPPKKRWENAIRDFNKAVDSEVKFIIEWLDWQNKMKRKEAEKNLWEIWDIDIDVLLWKDEEKWQKEVEEFEKIAKEEKKKSKKEKNKRMKEAVEEVLNIDIDTKREQQEKEKIEKMLKKVKNDETWKSKLWRELKTAFSTVDHKIKNISKPIYQALMQYFQNTSILTNERLKEATPFINALKKIRKENPVRYMDIRVALANRNIGYANGLLKEYGVKVPTKLLDTIYDEAEDVGLNINYLWSYYPLKVRSPKSLLTEIMWMKEWDFASEIDKRIKEESEKNWWPLDESQISDIIAEVIAWEDKWPDVRLWNAHMKKRNEKIKRTPKMLEYCYDPVTTLIGYIEWMTQSIERAKFLGKSASWQVRDLGTYVYKVKHDLTWEQQDELMYLLQAVFNDKQQWFLFNTWRDIATLTTLWSPTSTITQIWDLWFSIYENWLGNTWKALWNMWIKKWLFNLEDMGIINRWEEFTNINEKKTRFQKWINLVFKITWFSKMDMFGKSMYIKSTRLKRQKRAKKWENWDPQLRKDIMKRTDDEYVTDKIISDIRHWIFSKEVSMIMFMKLSNFQPLTRAQMPEAYLNHPWYIRMLYQFKTFGLKQTNYIISECKEALKEAKNWTPQQKREAVWRIVSLVASLALMWLWADELKDLLMRRRNESMILRAIFWDGNIDDKFVDKFVDNLAKLSWLSRYAIMNIKNDPVGIITSLFTDMPWENVINYPYRDIKNWLNGKSSDQMTQLFPVVWKRYYWAIWWWHDKQMEKLDKENNKSTKKTKSWSTRKPLTR